MVSMRGEVGRDVFVCVCVHMTFNPSTWGAEAGEPQSLRQYWSTEFQEVGGEIVNPLTHWHVISP